MHRSIAAFVIALFILAAPASAQDRAASDKKAAARAGAFTAMVVAEWNKKDAAALASHFTSNGLLMSPDGKYVTGPAAIKDYYAAVIKAFGDFTFAAEVKEAHALGYGIWAVISSSITTTGAGGPVTRRTHVSEILVPAGHAWKIRMINVGADVPPAR